MWRRQAGAHPDRRQHGDRKLTETFVTEFCYKSVNLSLKELNRLFTVPYFPVRSYYILLHLHLLSFATLQ